jgi:2-polyprenyl-6-hydroxyphenyl methylase/3-demethylubiquinone-9 3-methyltransferase
MDSPYRLTRDLEKMDAKPKIAASQNRRFPFGANWEAFLVTINTARLRSAQQSLTQMLGVDDLAGKRFLDIGSGSGLFSLAARQLGATVHSLDYDPVAVKCTQTLKQHYCPQDPDWIVESGSVLDETYLASLGQFDVVYAWGVLHHTGDMQKALENVIHPVSERGLLFIAIYNDQGIFSRFWQRVKHTYCASRLGKIAVSTVFIPVFCLQSIVSGLIKYKNPLGHFSNYKKHRGMSIYHDWIDWLGGYPFEVAKPEDIFTFYRHHGFVLENLITTNRLGCNQFVFRKHATSPIARASCLR